MIGASEEEKDHTEKRGSRVADCTQAAKKLCVCVFFFKTKTETILSHRMYENLFMTPRTVAEL